jgi:dolichol-phosphate mannosyltransferase
MHNLLLNTDNRQPPAAPATPLWLLSVIIPARDEEGCFASSVPHLCAVLDHRGVPHEIIVGDGSSAARKTPPRL